MLFLKSTLLTTLFALPSGFRFIFLFASFRSGRQPEQFSTESKDLPNGGELKYSELIHLLVQLTSNHFVRASKRKLPSMFILKPCVVTPFTEHRAEALSTSELFADRLPAQVGIGVSSEVRRMNVCPLAPFF
jgi:hypothetical protein